MTYEWIEPYDVKPGAVDRSLALSCSECGVFYDDKIPDGQEFKDIWQTYREEVKKHRNSEHVELRQKCSSITMRELDP